MFSNWLRHADPGLPRTLAYVLAWILVPAILAAEVLLGLLIYGAGSTGELVLDLKRSIHILWKQRLTMNLSPWKEAR